MQSSQPLEKRGGAEFHSARELRALLVIRYCERDAKDHSILKLSEL